MRFNSRSADFQVWFVPLLYAVGALVVSFTVPRLANNLLPGFVSTVSVNTAIGFYSAIASGMIALTAIVFSLTFVMVQFSATAYSPRLVLWVARDPIVSHALGVFAATFLYALAALVWVDRGGSGRVPLAGILVVGLLLIMSVMMFIGLIQRVGMLQVARMLIFTGNQGRGVIENLYPPIDTRTPRSYRLNGTPLVPSAPTQEVQQSFHIWSPSMKASSLFAETLMAALLAVPIFAQVTPTDEKVPCRNYKDVLALFNRLGYTQQAWQAGIREIPRVYLADVPDEWRERGATNLPVKDKKRLFFRVIAPIVLRINELILEDRVRAQELNERLAQGQNVTPEDQAWLTELAVKYKVLESTSERLDSNALAELLMRVDVIPPSLALAQAADESGWGTSRFAEQGNSLFGQWAWGKGLKPTEQRTSQFGDQRISAFGTTAQAAYAYALNLNTEHAYGDLRLRRADLRRQKLRISGTVLAETLLNYSERGQAYVDDLKALIRKNGLDGADDAYLRHMAVIHIVPAGPRAQK